jgi:hydroxysqualene synthase
MNLDARIVTGRPPTRTATTENFPVGSRLLPRELRGVVAAFYRFARAADDIADDPALDAATKLTLLGAMDKSVAGGTAEGVHPGLAYGRELRALFLERNLSLDHPRHLLEAFRADAANRPCRSWSDLLLYCRYSATPVGRFLLDLHGEDRSAYPASDALCTALQILNHMQDCQADYRNLQRIYIPGAWLDKHGLQPRELLGTHTPPPLRAVFDQLLDGVDRLNQTAAGLPGLIARRGLRMEATAILAISRRLAAKLRRRDPLAGRVALTHPEKAAAMITGVILGWRR